MEEENKKPVLIQIDNVRIVRYNDMNVVLERLELLPAKTVMGVDYPEHEDWIFKGYYGTKYGALQGILGHNLLDKEERVLQLEEVLLDFQSMMVKAKRDFKELTK